MKKISKMVIAALLLTSAAMSFPNWDSNISYNEGDTVTYNGKNYVASQATDPYNAKPVPGEDGWFWTETAETTEPTTPKYLVADKFSVNFGQYNSLFHKTELNNNGLEVNYSYPTGGHQSTSITTNSVEIEMMTTPDTLKTMLNQDGLVVESKTFSDIGPQYNSTTINAGEIATTGEIRVGIHRGLGPKTVISTNGLHVRSSLGGVTINDRGIVAERIECGGVNLNQKIAELESRIDQLEAIINNTAMGGRGTDL